MEQVLKIILSILAIYLSFYSFYWLLSTLLGLAYNPKKPEVKSAIPVEDTVLKGLQPKILLLLPAYKPGNIFIKVLESIKKAIQDHDIRVYVLLQEANADFREKIKSYGFLIEEAKFSHLAGNSYHHALRHIVQKIDNLQSFEEYQPDFVMLVDKDNLLSTEFFDNITSYDYLNNDVIQAKRCSINANGDVSFFDTISEGLNDIMFRAAKSLFNGVIEISGSGALIRTELFKSAILHLDANAPGYDKNFMVQVLSSPKSIRTVYLPYVQLFEEKTSELENYNPQRVRWFGEQYYNAIYSAGTLIKSFVRYRNFSAIEYLISLWRPPRSIHLLVVPFLAFVENIAYLLMGKWWLGFPFFLVSTLALILASVSFLVKENLLLTSIKHIFSLPKLAFSNLKNASASIKKENHGKFIHTEHKL